LRCRTCCIGASPVSEIARLELLIVRETEKWTGKTFRRQPVAVPMAIGHERPHTLNSTVTSAYSLAREYSEVDDTGKSQ
jgi:hypothetical protein